MNDLMFKHLSARELLRVSKDHAVSALEKALVDALEETLDELDSASECSDDE